MNLNTIATALQEMERQIGALRVELEKARAEKDDFAVLVYRSRRRFAWAMEHGNKSGKKEAMVIRDTYAEARRLGFKGSPEEWVRVLGAAWVTG